MTGRCPPATAWLRWCWAVLCLLTDEARFHAAYEKQLRFLSSRLQAYPAGHSVSLLALAEALVPPRVLVCSCAKGGMEDALLDALKGAGMHQLSVLVKTPGNADTLSSLSPWTQDYPLPKKGAMYYLCQGGACSAPTDDLQFVLAQCRSLPIQEQ